jgi:phosphodiesterase/alkaline phosphatase D-like protein
MKRLPLKLVLLVVFGNVLYATQAAAQESPTTKKAATVRIIRGPEVERVDPDFAIVRWTCNNPGGSPEHEGVVRYGTDPKKLSQTAKSPVRLNPEHSHTVFRVRMNGLEPGTTYYYRIDSSESNGKADNVKSALKHFKTPLSAAESFARQ